LLHCVYLARFMAFFSIAVAKKTSFRIWSETSGV
jgi:hypothetical protein